MDGFEKDELLKKSILENQLSYCHFFKRKSKIETVDYFAVFGNPEEI